MMIFYKQLFLKFMAENKDCQIILLCGYFGSGKTTLIKHILENQQGLKIAVIQNEFADGKRLN
jgi:Ni2+-binding GTPase involved in maturation of urease and hydrogenase